MSSGLNIQAELAKGSNGAFGAMTGAQRAAALLLLLGESEGAPIWQMLDEDEVKLVSHAMVQLGSLEAETVEKLIVDFVSRLSSGGGITSNFERTESLLLKIFPSEQVSAIMAEIKGASGKMLRMETVQKEALRHIEETLRVEFVSTIAQTTRRDAHELMADVFNAFDRQTEGRFLTALDQANRGSAKKIRQLMFTFEDLLKLDAGSVQTLLRKVDNETLCRALKGADERVRGFFLKNMSTRAAKNITDEMGSLGPIRLKDVDEAQAKMTELAKDLAEKGEIMIAKSSGEEELVY